MTIDEAIAKYKEITNTDASCPMHCCMSSCDKFVKECEQLAEWLEELKCYKNDNDFSDYADRLHKIAFNSGYIKPDALHLRVDFSPEAAYQSEERCVMDGYEKLYDDPQRGPVYAKRCEHYNVHDGSSDYTYTYAVIEGYC